MYVCAYVRPPALSTVPQISHGHPPQPATFMHTHYLYGKVAVCVPVYACMYLQPPSPSTCCCVFVCTYVCTATFESRASKYHTATLPRPATLMYTHSWSGLLCICVYVCMCPKYHTATSCNQQHLCTHIYWNMVRLLCTCVFEYVYVYSHLPLAQVAVYLCMYICTYVWPLPPSTVPQIWHCHHPTGSSILHIHLWSCCCVFVRTYVCMCVFMATFPEHHALNIRSHLPHPAIFMYTHVF